MVIAAMKLKDVCFLEGKICPRQCFKKQRHHFADKGPYSGSHGFSSSMDVRELDHKELMLSNCGAGEDS